MQLETGQFHGQDVDPGLGDDRRDRFADVPDRGHRPAVRGEDRLQHADRGRLAVRAGDYQPRGRFAGGCSGDPQSPREFDLADDLQPGRCGGDQKRVLGGPPGAGHQQFRAGEVVRRPVLVLGQVRAGPGVDRGHLGTGPGQRPGGGGSGRADPGDHRLADVH